MGTRRAADHGSHAAHLGSARIADHLAAAIACTCAFFRQPFEVAGAATYSNSAASADRNIISLSANCATFKTALFSFTPIGPTFSILLADRIAAHSRAGVSDNPISEASSGSTSQQIRLRNGSRARLRRYFFGMRLLATSFAIGIAQWHCRHTPVACHGYP